MGSMFDILIRNPQSKIRNNFCSNAPKLIETESSQHELLLFGL
jgi:hypothetical protein